MRLLYNKSKVDNDQFDIYHLHYKEKPGIIESIYNPFFFQLLPKLLLSLTASFDYYGYKNLSATFFFAFNGCTYIVELAMAKLY